MMCYNYKNIENENVDIIDIISIQELSHKLGGEKINSFLWIDEEKILLKTSLYENSSFWEYNISSKEIKELFKISNNTFYLSKIYLTNKGYNVSEFGGYFYKIEDSVLSNELNVENIKNDYERFVNAMTGDICQFDHNSRELTLNENNIFHLPKSDVMNFPRHISVSPNNELVSFSVLKDEYFIDKNVLLDIKTNNIIETTINLMAPYFIWIDNKPCYIDTSQKNVIAIYDSDDIKKIKINGEAYFESSQYNLGMQNNLVAFTEKNDSFDTISLMNINDYSIKNVFSGDNLFFSKLTLSPKCNNIAFISSNMKNLSDVNLIIARIK